MHAGSYKFLFAPSWLAHRHTERQRLTDYTNTQEPMKSFRWLDVIDVVGASVSMLLMAREHKQSCSVGGVSGPDLGGGGPMGPRAPGLPPKGGLPPNPGH